MEISKIEAAISNSYTYSDCIRNLKWPDNGSSYRKIKLIIKNNAIDISHFDRYHRNKERRKYNVIKKTCPICGKKFDTLDGHPQEKTTCSYSCSNTYFNGIVRNVNEDNLNYRTICFRHHGKQCIICGEKNIVAVHHMDQNHGNKSPENLIPLCPTHHGYWHSKYRSEIEDAVIGHINDFIRRDDEK